MWFAVDDFFSLFLGLGFLFGTGGALLISSDGSCALGWFSFSFFLNFCILEHMEFTLVGAILYIIAPLSGCVVDSPSSKDLCQRRLVGKQALVLGSFENMSGGIRECYLGRKSSSSMAPVEGGYRPYWILLGLLWGHYIIALPLVATLVDGERKI